MRAGNGNGEDNQEPNELKHSSPPRQHVVIYLDTSKTPIVHWSRAKGSVRGCILFSNGSLGHGVKMGNNVGRDADREAGRGEIKLRAGDEGKLGCGKSAIIVSAGGTTEVIIKRVIKVRPVLTIS